MIVNSHGSSTGFPRAYAISGFNFRLIGTNSDFLNGVVQKEAIAIVNDRLEAMGIGKKKVNFRMRDAAFSRQRYWGEPFPLLHQVDAQGNLLGNIEPIETFIQQHIISEDRKVRIPIDKRTLI